MGKYRIRQPAVIEAEQYRNEPYGWPKGVCTCDAFSVGGHGPHVHTLRGITELDDGDWIVPEPDGAHFYTVKPEVVEVVYEEVKDN